MSDSKYCYPGTNVLINIPGIKNEIDLRSFERMTTSLRMLELKSNPIAGSFDLAHMQKIHRHIFQDVYSFAGKIRDVDIAKGNTLFCKADFIQDNARMIMGELQNEKLLKGLPGEEFADRAAYYMAELNVLHPFREGNGRTLREYIKQLANEAGHALEWSRVDKDVLFKESVRSVSDYSGLAKVILEAINPSESDQQLQSAKEHSELGHSPEALLLSDVIKKIGGFPSIHNKLTLNAALLNREVSNYQLHEGKHNILEVELKGIGEKLLIRMDAMPYVSQASKEKWIDLASRSLSEPPIRDFDKEP